MAETPATVEGRYRAGLQAIVARADLEQSRPDRAHPTEAARQWSDGHYCGLLAARQVAAEALDPEGEAAVQGRFRFLGNASDSEYYQATGHCGTCGVVADTCQCEPDGCGCWEDHGPPKAAWVPLGVQIERLTERLNAVLALCDKHERGALRWEHPLPVPEWVDLVREAATGEPQQRKLFMTGVPA